MTGRDREPGVGGEVSSRWRAVIDDKDAASVAFRPVSCRRSPTGRTAREDDVDDVVLRGRVDDVRHPGEQLEHPPVVGQDEGTEAVHATRFGSPQENH